MTKPQKLEIMVLVSGRTPKAICRHFQRNKWSWNQEVINKFIELSQAEKRKSTLIKEIEELSNDTLSH